VIGSSSWMRWRHCACSFAAGRMCKLLHRRHATLGGCYGCLRQSPSLQSTATAHAGFQSLPHLLTKWQLFVDPHHRLSQLRIGSGWVRLPDGIRHLDGGPRLQHCCDGRQPQPHGGRQLLHAGRRSARVCRGCGSAGGLPSSAGCVCRSAGRGCFGATCAQGKAVVMPCGRQGLAVDAHTRACRVSTW